MKYPFEKHVLVCIGKSCLGEPIQEALKDYNKSKGRKPTVRVCRVSCLDLCDHGPNMIIDNIVYSHLDVDRARSAYDGAMGDGPLRTDLELRQEEFEAGCSAAAPRHRK